VSASRLNTEQLGRAFASSADAPASRSAVRWRRIVILVWCTTGALAISAVIGLSVWQGVQEKKLSKNLDIPLQSVQPDGFISNPSGDLQMINMNNVLMAGAVASAASLGMCVDASAQSSAVQWTTASGGNGHWYQYVPTALRWPEAKLAAEARNGYLACLTSAAESAFARGLGVEIAHLGGFQAPDTCEPNCGWQWLSGEPWSYTQWAPTQPDNGSGVEDVLELQLAGNWNDYEATSYRNSFIIEYSADCNSDGIVDYGQILSGQLIDVNSNGIPDICEVDPCPGDISGNNSVDGVDLAALLGTWGTNGQGEFNCDIDLDGIVGGTDLTIILGGWGPCPPPILPWATVLEQNVNPAVVTDATLRNAITASGLPWRVRDNGTNIEMLLVPGGIFMMGCSPGDAECYESENPAHQVTLTNAFYMSKTEVTQAQWQAKMGSNPSTFQGQADSPSRPVENVSWIMAQGFNTATGFRLPTEAEWEYACRAGTTTARYGLENNISWNLFNSDSVSHAVATKLPNALGLYDTLGNVWEWCQDWYGDMYYASSPSENPTGPTAGTYRVLHGGGLLAGSDSTRASVRGWNIPSNVQNVYGFRVARNP
jgi:formylglycine-generating enzyme required for sulfatase activity